MAGLVPGAAAVTGRGDRAWVWRGAVTGASWDRAAAGDGLGAARPGAWRGEPAVRRIVSVAMFCAPSLVMLLA